MGQLTGLATLVLIGLSISATTMAQPLVVLRQPAQWTSQPNIADPSSYYPTPVELPRNALIRFGRSHPTMGELPRNALVRFGRSSQPTTTLDLPSSQEAVHSAVRQVTHDDITGAETDAGTPQPYFRK